MSGVDLDLARDLGCTRLITASTGGNVDAALLLLQNNAWVNQADDNGASPLYCASKKGAVDVVALLLQNKADVNQPNSPGTSPGELHAIHIRMNTR